MDSMPKYESYKDSGVEWLSKLPTEWDLVANKHIFNLKKNLVGKRSSEYELLSLTLKGIIKRDMENPEGKFPAEFDTYQEVKVDDFVFCLFDVEETPRTVGLSSYDGMITGAYTVFDVKPEYDPRFLYYFYLNLDASKRLKPLYKGLRNTIPKDAFLSFKTFAPTRYEQTAIANFLDRKTVQIDEAIAIKEKQIARLKERNQIIIQQAVTQGLDPNVPMKDSGVDWIGRVPSSWSIRKLKHLVSFLGGGTPSKENSAYWNGNILWVSPKDMKTELIVNSIDSITEVALKKSSVKLIPENSILIVVRGMILAKKIPVSIAGKVLTINQDMKGMVVDLRQCYPAYLRLLLDGLHEELSTLLEESGHGTKTLPTEKLGGFYLPLPPQEEQHQILKFVEAESIKITQACRLQEEQIEKLKEYKTTLINSAVTGKIKVA
ncbi:MAG: type I restriction endonuclease subunit S [Alteromonadaceae bacterium]|nr:type I restriction endonuclease subunit S [Alteromonadaceae bacterium]|tara:strand:+ start:5089 stop:6390 length:1302 start_codon:yes stop_codon:yes gene_type:complete